MNSKADTASSPQIKAEGVKPDATEGGEPEPFFLTDDAGNHWTLHAYPTDSGSAGKPIIRLTASTVAEISDVPFRIEATQFIVSDGSLLGQPHLGCLLPRGGGLTGAGVQRGLRRKAQTLVERALTPERCQTVVPRALVVAHFSARDRLRISDATWVALASEQELREEIVRLEDQLRPGGGEDEIVARLATEIASIRPNSPRKRRRIAEKKEQLEDREIYRDMKATQLAACARRLAELEATAA
jgi:hypothetical protein